MQSDDLPTPTTQIGTVGTRHPTLSPQQLIMFFSADEWEQFIWEWATAAREEYRAVKRVGGTGDGGVDVAGFRTSNGLEGEWHCFQCKHYASSIGWADLLPELVKVFRHTLLGDYALPTRYVVLAPRGVSRALERLILKPTQMREKFLDEASKWLSEDERQGVLDLAAATDFAMFESAEIDVVLETHSRTSYYSVRFGSELPMREIPGSPPQGVQPEESVYVQRLVEVYSERWAEIDSVTTAETHERSRAHFAKQRIRFFRAEALRAYARDSVPEGTFERFQEDIYNGVIDTADMTFNSGWDRLTNVMASAGHLNLTSHLLVTRAEQDDIKGACHQLANDGKLHWVDE